MRAATRFAFALGFGVALAGQCAPAFAAQPYEGFWASTKRTAATTTVLTA